MRKGSNVGCHSTLSKQWRGRISYWSRRYSAKSTVSGTNDAVKDDLTAPSKLLPTSPLLDAAYQEAREKAAFRQPKPLPKPADLTAFQRRLAANPYAHALATPVRQCSISHTKLPSHFLLGLAVESTNPSTNMLSIAPRLSEKASAGLRSYLLNSRSVVEQATNAKSWKRLVSEDMQERFKVTYEKSNQWARPKDLGNVVLHDLRQSAYAKMRWAFSMPNANLIIMPEALGEESGNAACILRLKLGETPIIAKQSLLPEHHLHTLLGEDLLGKLLQDTRFASAEAVMVADSHLTTVMRSRLLKLQAFLDFPLQ